MNELRYGSVCSGIEAATVAWHPLGWHPQFFSEIEAAPRAVLKHHWPEVPLHGDFTTIREGEYGAIDLLVGGTPCQSFSVAGLRGGLADDRGNLALQYLRLAQRLRPRWLVWENVPGVLSSNGGRDFGAILGGMVELGYGFAYRVLDAQYVRVDGYGRAVPQRRRRVFVVGYLGNWRCAAAVLFERASLRGDPAPRREARERPAPTLSARPSGGGGLGTDFDCDGGLVARCLTRGSGGGQRYDAETEALVAHALRGEGFDASEDGSGRGTPIVPIAACLNGLSEYGAEVPTLRAKGGDAAGGSEALIAFDTTQITSRENRANPQPGDPCHPLSAGAHLPAIAFSCKDHGADATDEGVTPTLRAMGHSGSHANAGGQMAVAYGIRSDASREGSAKTPSADAEGRMRLRNPGLGIYDGLAPTLDAGQPHTVAAPLASTVETMYGVSHADASQTGPDQALRALRDAVDEEAYSEWGTGVVAALRAQEILRSGVHGEGVRCAPDSWDRLGDDASSRAEAGSTGPVRALWEAGCDGCPPQGWQPSERLAQELGAHLSLLPHKRASAARFMLGLWRASEGLGLLREALSALQEIWRPEHDAGQSAQVASPLWQVRRLTPTECERLMGFPDDYTLVPWRSGLMADGPRYKALGNSMAVNVMRWIGRRIEMVEALEALRASLNPEA